MSVETLIDFVLIKCKLRLIIYSNFETVDYLVRIVLARQQTTPHLSVVRCRPWPGLVVELQLGVCVRGHGLPVQHQAHLQISRLVDT